MSRLWIPGGTGSAVAASALGLAFLFLLVVSLRRPSSGLAVAAGAFLAAAVSLFPTTLVLAPLMAAALFDGEYPRRVRASLAGSALFGFAFAFGLGWLLFRAGRS